MFFNLALDVFVVYELIYWPTAIFPQKAPKESRVVNDKLKGEDPKERTQDTLIL